jgi:hypothetical protein
MSNFKFKSTWRTADQAHLNLNRALWPACKKELEQGTELCVTVIPLEDQRSIQQNSYMWAVVLREISEQATIGGIGATPEGWHLYFKRKILGYEFIKIKLPGSKRLSVIKQLRSTTGLSVKKMSEYLEEVIATAATDLNVRFSVSRWQEYQ